MHVTFASPVTCVPTVIPTDSPDAALLALLPALKAAVREREQFGDRNTDGHPNARPYEDTIERRACLHKAVDAAAAPMLALRPRTLTGLLLTAQAGAAAMDWLWEDGEDDRGPAERILRTLCDNLFALFGVDRHGRYHGGVPLPDPDTEAAIVRMLTGDTEQAERGLDPDAAIDSRTALDACNANLAAAVDAVSDRDLSSAVSGDLRAAIHEYRAAVAVVILNAMTPEGATEQSRTRIDAAGAALRATPSRTPADLRAKLVYLVPLILDRMEDSPGRRFLENIRDDADRLARAPRFGRDQNDGPVPDAAAESDEVDRELTEAAAELDRLRTEISALTARHPNMPLVDVPGAGTLDFRRWCTIKNMTAIVASSAAGLRAKAHVLRMPTLIKNQEQHTLLAVSLAEDIEWMATPVMPTRSDTGTAGSTTPLADPAFAAAEAHRAAHIAWLAALKTKDDAASGAAFDRKREAFQGLLRTRPRTEAGELVLARHVLFELAHMAPECEFSSEMACEAGRLVNRGLPVEDDSVPREAIEPTAAAISLDAAIEAHMTAYAHRLQSGVANSPDADERAEQEREAFRTLLHMPLGSDAARSAYATAVIGRAGGYHGDECFGDSRHLGAGRNAPLAIAYRNLAFGEYVREPDAPTMMAAE